MDPILDLAREHDLFVIEDTAEAFGGKYKGKMAGTIGNAGAISFCQNKTFTTGGEGGMVVTDDEDLAWRCRSFRDHGYDVAERLRLLELEQKLPYIHNMVGWNYRMTEMQSAIGLAELMRVDNWNMPCRQRNAMILIDALKSLPEVLHLPINTPERQNGWYVFPITLAIEKMSCDIRQFVDALTAEGAPCWRVFWPQCHTEKAFREHHGAGRFDFPFKSKEYTDPASVDYSDVEVPNARWHESHTFVTFIFPTYTEQNMQEIAEAIKKVIAAYAK
jgi:dTDP-4-amino-4,6-dideoxygalactose transaminase